MSFKEAAKAFTRDVAVMSTSMVAVKVGTKVVDKVVEVVKDGLITKALLKAKSVN